jgi:hypothetical protein
MFVAVFYWVLTVFFLIIYITTTYTRIPQVPWTTVVRKPWEKSGRRPSPDPVPWGDMASCQFGIIEGGREEAKPGKAGAADSLLII